MLEVKVNGRPQRHVGTDPFSVETGSCAKSAIEGVRNGYEPAMWYGRSASGNLLMTGSAICSVACLE